MDDISQLSDQDELKRISSSNDLPAEMLMALSAKLRHERDRLGDFAVVEGEVGDSLHVIDSGQAQVSVGTGAHERIVNHLRWCPGTS